MSTIPILCGFDRHYAMPAAVMLFSALENLAPEHALDAYLVTPEGFPASLKERIDRVLEQDRDRISTNWVTPATGVKSLPTSSHPMSKHVTTSMYYRLLAPHVVPTAYGKAIYLDVDVVVEGDLASLYEIDIHDFAIAAVPNFGNDEHETKKIAQTSIDYRSLDINPDNSYFNSGLLTINLDYWRTHDIATKVIEYCNRHRDTLEFADQDGLNAILYDSWRALPSEWNVNLPGASSHFGLDDDELRHHIAGGKFYILHYGGPHKPWNTLGRAPGHDRFYYYLRRSKWFGPAEYISFRAHTKLKAIYKGLRRRLSDQ